MTKLSKEEYRRRWYQKHKEYSKMYYYEHKVHHYAKVDEEARKRKYRFIKEYEHFVLLERLDNHCKECFSKDEINQLEVI